MAAFSWHRHSSRLLLMPWIWPAPVGYLTLFEGVFQSVEIAAGESGAQRFLEMRKSSSNHCIGG